MMRGSSVFPRTVIRKHGGGMASAARRKKVVVIMGPTGCGKTRLSVDLASRFYPSPEIINADKIQVYRGLDITTNKVPFRDRKNVAHHFIGEFRPTESRPEFTPSDFRSAAGLAVSRILSRRRLPLVVGGSNSFIYALLAKRYRPEVDVFGGDVDSVVVCRETRYDCCFISVHVSPPVLNRHLEKRVDDMLESGMFDELGHHFADPTRPNQCGLEKAIGVAEFERYFSRFKTDWRRTNGTESEHRIKTQEYEAAVRSIKSNTLHLAKKQQEKIHRLRVAAGWNLNTVDATEATAAGETDFWETQVVEESVKIVKRFLAEE
ncbi:adenylate isopentenyltransferase [Genlisea aurea]|uniref:Adenylate isopentenyltransferase n=1 Tax=Genlisea aurea TaxID=192259 RepID=S8D1N7_9LAMI|nr:adenylate isopentenyltransferase [Genlisea aurea]